MISRPRLLDRAWNFISITPSGHDGESIVLTERRPRAVDVSFAQGQRRNASAREVRMKREKEKNAKNAKKNHGQQLSSSISAVATATSAQQSSGAAHTQQSSQPQVLLTTTPAAAAMSITGTPLHPDIVIRQPGLSTRLRLFLCCISAEIADDDH
ncbi:hypothetical protein K503DRAFT_774180 [Rhizopogon vinicolor AM-OR11-026]|uniref:Uncharacterized protein n=1 Tax=Rhizopogon vinicolor AM-OR11-026 TaxID=1314800 RepID=A0A1B7MQC8_9AGAM|nr:hypothetical protein K503DRAFT_774180 [Rhizopogon vinicolor AM-OR11-026]